MNSKNIKEVPIVLRKALPTLTTKIYEDLQTLMHTQGQSGNWNYDPYMHGMFNGMDLMLAILEDRDPEYRSAPKVWLDSISLVEAGAEPDCRTKESTEKEAPNSGSITVTEYY